MRMIKSKTGRRLRLRAIPTIDTLNSSDQFGKFLSDNVPYLSVSPSNNTIVMDGYTLTRGDDASNIYILNKDLTLSRPTARSATAVNEKMSVADAKSMLTKGFNVDGFKIHPTDLSLYEKTNIFDREKLLKYASLAKSPEGYTNTINQLFTGDMSNPIGDSPNVIHFFIFINEITSLIKILSGTMPLQNVFGSKGKWNLQNSNDIIRLSEIVNEDTINMTMDDMMKNPQYGEILSSVANSNKTSGSAKRASMDDDDIEATPSTKRARISKKGNSRSVVMTSRGMDGNRHMEESIDNLMNVFNALEKVGEVEHLGYLIMLNYWMYHVSKQTLIENMYPINPEQQIRRLLDTFGDDDASILVEKKLRIYNLPDVTKSKLDFEGSTDDIAFKIIQVLTWDNEKKLFDPTLLTSSSEALSNYMVNFNSNKVDLERRWVMEVCGRDIIKYRYQGDSLSKKQTYLMRLFNRLTNTSYPTIREWFENVSSGNKFISDIDIDDGSDEGIRVVINNVYALTIESDHMHFSVEPENNVEEYNRFHVSKSFAELANEFGLNDVSVTRYIVSAYNSAGFRLSYLKNFMSISTIMKFSEEIISNISHPEDLVEYSNKFGKYDKIIERATIPIPPGVIPNNIKTLIIQQYAHAVLTPGAIPLSVTDVLFDSANIKISEGIIPPSVTRLTFGKNFNQPLKPGDIPGSVTHLTFNKTYEHPIPEDVLNRIVSHSYELTATVRLR